MRINEKTYGIMKDAMKILIEYYGRSKVRMQYKLRSRATLWGLWDRAANDMNYNNAHFYYKTVRRILPCTGFTMDKAISDDHIESALDKIAQELGLGNEVEPVKVPL